MTQHKNVSEATARKIDSEIKSIIDEATARRSTILTEHIDELHAMARALLEFETLSGEEIRGIMRGDPVIRTPVDELPPPESRRSSVPSSGRAAPPVSPGQAPQPA